MCGVPFEQFADAPVADDEGSVRELRRAEDARRGRQRASQTHDARDQTAYSSIAQVQLRKTYYQ